MLFRPGSLTPGHSRFAAAPGLSLDAVLGRLCFETGLPGKGGKEKEKFTLGPCVQVTALDRGSCREWLSRDEQGAKGTTAARRPFGAWLLPGMRLLLPPVMASAAPQQALSPVLIAQASAGAIARHSKKPRTQVENPPVVALCRDSLRRTATFGEATDPEPRAPGKKNHSY